MFTMTEIGNLIPFFFSGPLPISPRLDENLQHKLLEPSIFF